MGAATTNGRRPRPAPRQGVGSERRGSKFPFHPNWKTEATHPAYWEVGATIDHMVPVTLGGADEPANWVTTSMARNSLNAAVC
jgi:hypothetical protein